MSLAAKTRSVTAQQIDEAIRLAEIYGLRFARGGERRLALIITHVTQQSTAQMGPAPQPLPICKNWDGWSVG